MLEGLFFGIKAGLIGVGFMTTIFLPVFIIGLIIDPPNLFKRKK